MARVPGMTRRRKEGQILVGVEVVKDDWPEEIKNAVAIRNATWIDGQMPHCGAMRKLTAFPELSLVSATLVHDDSCPVSDLLDPQEP